MSSTSSSSLYIVQQPAPRTAVVGQSYTDLFSVVASSPFPVTYRWQHSVNGGATYFDINPSGGVFTGSRTSTLGVYSGMTDMTSVWNGAKFRCVVESNGQTIISSPGTLTVVLSLPPSSSSSSAGTTQAGPSSSSSSSSDDTNQAGSSSSSQTYNIFLDNIDLFRQYSLDADLIELYYNKGVLFRTVDLDDNESDSSSSSSSSFKLTINIAWVTYPTISPPNDLQIYVYDEEAGGVPAPGMMNVQQVQPGAIEATLDGGHDPDGTLNYSFRINIEHPEIMPLRIRFEFLRAKNYEYQVYISEKILGEQGRLDEAYKQYLLQWIGQFWYAWDVGDQNLIPDFYPPFNGSFIPFNPFSHARWKILSDAQTLGALADYTTTVILEPGNSDLVKGLNFLSISPEIWKKIKAAELYSFKGYPQEKYTPEEWIKGFKYNGIDGVKRKYKDPDYSFDCRSFSAIGAEYLRKQLSGICPQAEVKVAAAGGHFFCYVDLKGEKPCCNGKFIWDPQIGGVYDNISDPWVQQNLQDGFDKPLTVYEPGKENSDGDFGDPNWEDSIDELRRIAGLICDNIRTSAPRTAREQELLDICDQAAPPGTPAEFQSLGAMPQWISDNLSFTPDNGATTEFPAIEPPQDAECKKCIISFRASWNCLSQTWITYPPSGECMAESEVPAQLDQWLPVNDDPCYIVQKMEAPTDAYEGDSMCGFDGDCLRVALNLSKAPKTPKQASQDCADLCVEGVWCERDPALNIKTGKCEFGYKTRWKTMYDQGKAFDFEEGKSCEDTVCEEQKAGVFYLGDDNWGGRRSVLGG